MNEVTTKQCPFCAEEIKKDAILCRLCGSDLSLKALIEESTGTDSSEELLLRDPLKEATRKEGRFLLIVSLITFASTNAGIIPAKISALGLECSRVEQDWFLFLLGIVVLYFWISFLVYEIPDVMNWLISRDTARKNQDAFLKQSAKFIDEQIEQDVGRWVGPEGQLSKDEVAKTKTDIREQFAPFLGPYRFGTMSAVSAVRAFFDFTIPFVVGAIAIVAVYRKIPSIFWSGLSIF